MTHPASIAALRLSVERDAIARAVTDRLYEERPELMERYGARGRARCLEDLGHTIDHLVPAVELDVEALFTRYVRWLDELLRARKVDTGHTIRSLELLAEVAARTLPPDESKPVRRILRAGLAQLGVEGA